MAVTATIASTNAIVIARARGVTTTLGIGGSSFRCRSRSTARACLNSLRRRAASS